MAHVTEIENGRGDATLQPIFEREEAAFGHVLNTTKVLAHCPPILAAAKSRSSSLPRPLPSRISGASSIGLSAPRRRGSVCCPESEEKADQVSPTRYRRRGGTTSLKASKVFQPGSFGATPSTGTYGDG